MGSSLSSEQNGSGVVVEVVGASVELDVEDVSVVVVVGSRLAST